jgi:hypothetical protein
MRRIGVLMSAGESDPVAEARVSAFTQALAALGYDRRNVRIDLRAAAPGDTNRLRALAQELVGLRPDIILARSTPATVALQQGCIKRKNPDKMRVSESSVLKSVTNRSGRSIILAVAKTRAASAGSAQTGEPAAAAGCSRIRAPGG